MSTDVTVSDLDERIFEARVAGASEHVVAKRFGCTPLDVRRVVDRLAPKIDAAVRMHEFALEVLRIDALMETYYQMALEKDHQAALITIKLSERRSSLWAFDHAPHRDLATISAPPPERPTSTARIRAALERIVAARPAPQPQPQPVEILPPEGAP